MAGSYKVALVSAGKPVAVSPYTMVLVPTAVSAVKSVASGEGLSKAVAGQVASFALQTKDRFGNNLLNGGEIVTADLSKTGVIVSCEVKDLGNGIYGLAYTATEAGQYTAMIKINGVAIASTDSFAITVNPAVTNAAVSHIDEANDEWKTCVAGVFCSATFQARDVFGNKKIVGGSAFVASVADGVASITDNSDGTYEVEYMHTVAASHALVIELAGVVIKDMPATVVVLPAIADAAKSVLSGDGLYNTTAGVATTFHVQAKDVYDNLLTSGGDSFNVQLVGPAPVMNTFTTDGGDGTYSITFTTKVSGVFETSVYLGVAAAGASPVTTTVTPAATNATMTNMYGAGLSGGDAGIARLFMVQAKDSFGNKQIIAGDDVAVFVSNEEGGAALEAMVTSTYEGRGLYSVSYTLFTVGSYYVATTINGAASSGSPFRVNITTSDNIAPSKCTATGTGLSVSTAGKESTFEIQAVGVYDNLATEGGEKFVVKISGVETNVLDKGDGKYTVAYTPSVSGPFNIDVLLYSAPIQGSPFAMVTAPAVTSTQMCVGSQQNITTAGVQTTFGIQAKDVFGNLRISGGDVYTVKVTKLGSQSVYGQVTDNTDGTYTVAYTVTESGPHSISVMIGGMHISNSPSSLLIVPAITNEKESVTTVVNQQLSGEGQCATSSEQCEAFGASQSQSVAFDPSCADPSSDKYGGLGCNANNLDCCRYCETGIYSSLTCPSTTPSEVHAVAGDFMHLHVQAKDEFGNRRLQGGDVVTLTGLSKVGVVNTTDNTDGTYVIVSNVTVIGHFSVDVMVNGASSHSFILTAHGAAPSGALTNFTGAGISSGTAGVEMAFQVQTYDIFGNAKTSGGDAFSVSIETGTPMKVVDELNGMYSVSYTVETIGTFAVDVTVDGQGVADAPYDVEIAPNVMDISRSNLIGNGSAVAVAGEDAVFTLFSHDTYGNPRSTGGEQLRLQMTSEETGLLDWTVNGVDNQDGSYSFVYSDTEQIGMFSLVLTQVSTQQTLAVPVLVVAGPTFPTVVRSSVMSFASANIDDLAPNTPERAQFEEDFVEAMMAELDDQAGGDSRARVTITSIAAGSVIVEFSVELPEEASTLLEQVKASGNSLTVGGVTADASSMATPAVEPMVTYSYMSNASIDTLAVGSMADVPLRLTIQACDRHGNLKNSGGDEFLVDAPEPLNSTFVDNGDGSYVLSINAQEAGSYAFDVLYGEAKLTNGPYAVDFRSAQASSEMSTFSATTTLEAGKETVVSIHAFDEFENPLTKGGDHFTVRMSGAVDVNAKIADSGDGTYTATMTPTVKGAYIMDVMLGKEVLSSAPASVTVWATKSQPSECYASGEGLFDGIAGVVNSFVIQARDVYGNDQHVGGDEFQVQMSGSNNIVNSSFSGDGVQYVTVTDLKNGKYLVEYKVTVSDIYQTSISLDLEQIQTLYSTEIEVAVTDAQASTVLGALVVDSSSAQVGETYDFSIIARDEFGNERTVGGDVFEVSLKGTQFSIPKTTTTGEVTSTPFSADISVSDGNDGTYTFSTRQTVVGEYTLSVRLASSEIGNTPVGVTMQSAASDSDTSAAFCADSANCGLRTGIAGVSGEFSIRMRDRFGNPCETEELTMEMTHLETNVTIQVIMGEDDESSEGSKRGITLQASPYNSLFKVNYQLSVSGGWALIVSANGMALPGSPFSLDMAPAITNAAASLASGTGISNATAGVEAVFEVQARDQFGNVQIEAGDVWTAVLSGPGPTDVISFGGVSAGEGVYDFEYTTTVSGLHQMSIELQRDGQSMPLSGSPFAVQVTPAELSPEQSILLTTITNVTAGSFLPLLIQERDAFGNRRAVSTVFEESTLTAELRQGNNAVACNSTDKADGTHATWCYPTLKGTQQLHLQLSKVAIEDSPFDVLVLPGPTLAANCIASGPGLTKARPGFPGSFQITAYDSFNNVKDTGDDDFVVTFKKTSSEGVASFDAEGQVLDQHDGTYLVKYTMEWPGTFSVGITLNGADIKAPEDGGSHEMEVLSAGCEAGLVMCPMREGEEVQDCVTDYNQCACPAGQTCMCATDQIMCSDGTCVKDQIMCSDCPSNTPFCQATGQCAIPESCPNNARRKLQAPSWERRA
jgi:hypothetical protein